MRQVFYIEADEEMISVIGRVRKSPASENIIVAPHRSLILQSIVNLRLLSHDARKNGKEIIIVTQDAQSRSLCEKAGIRTQPVLDEEYAHTNQQLQQRADPLAVAQQNMYDRSASLQEQSQEISTQEKSQTLQFPLADTLGSADFSGEEDVHTQSFQPVEKPLPKQPSMESFSKPLYSDIKRVIIHDKNPQKLTMLNSHRFEEETLLRQQKSFTPPSLRGTQPIRPLFTPTHVPIGGNFASNTSNTPPPQENVKTSFGFLGHRKTPLVMPIARKLPEKQVVVSDGGKMRAFFIFFGLISILSVAGVCAYVFLPKATIHVKLKTITQKSDFEFNGSSKISVPSAESKTIPVRILEKTQEVSRSFDATGKASLADQKARGSVTISNEYSVDPQLLVASTRLLSQDGKVFRLLSGVTVPGMTTVGDKTAPGAIEATVIADQSGQEYNIPPETFTIPGFVGSAKYAKFSAKSTSAMSGGGTSGSDATSVSDQDVAKAKKDVESNVKAMAEDIVNQDINSGEKVLSEATDVTVVSSTVSPQSGAITSSFDYRVKLHIRAFVFSEDDLKKMIITLFSQQDVSKGSLLSPNMIDLQYGEPTEDFAAGTFRISVHAEGHSESGIDEEQLQSDLLGQNESDIAVVLQKYTQIDSISIELWPEFLTSRIPTRANRVSIVVDPIGTGSGK